MTVRVGVLVSGSGTNLQALLDAISDMEGAEVGVVISNNKTSPKIHNLIKWSRTQIDLIRNIVT